MRKRRSQRHQRSQGMERGRNVLHDPGKHLSEKGRKSPVFSKARTALTGNLPGNAGMRPLERPWSARTFSGSENSMLILGSPMNVTEAGIEHRHHAKCGLADLKLPQCEMKLRGDFRFVDYGLDFLCAPDRPGRSWPPGDHWLGIRMPER